MVRYPEYDGTQNCYNIDTNVFYNVNTNSYIPGHKDELEIDVRGICASCSFLVECRDWAIENERYGFWGGLSEVERMKIRRRIEREQNRKLRASTE